MKLLTKGTKILGFINFLVLLRAITVAYDELNTKELK